MLPPDGPVRVKLAAPATGVTEFDAADGALLPTPLVALTVQVYAVPFVKPATVIGLALPDPVLPPGPHVTVYPVIGEPPVLDDAVNVTVAELLPAVAVPIVGADGGVL